MLTPLYTVYTHDYGGASYHTATRAMSSEKSSVGIYKNSALNRAAHLSLNFFFSVIDYMFLKISLSLAVGVPPGSPGTNKHDTTQGFILPLL